MTGVVPALAETSKYNHNRPESSGTLQLYRPTQPQPLAAEHEATEPQPLEVEHEAAELQSLLAQHEIAEPQPPVPEHEIPPNTAIGRSLVRCRIQEGLWDEFDMPKGSTVKLNRCSTVITTKA
ncbi:hypothetical protein LZ32DRAFT_645653 [Colletotrichum eremochloae]|nr:hypothetical protein LZ32DRAFT_645653 [Colletotrichum eremochloae]